MKFRIQNITCGRCVKTITRTIHIVDPSAQVSMQPSEKVLIVSGKLFSDAARQAIKETGYSTQPIDQLC